MDREYQARLVADDFTRLQEVLRSECSSTKAELVKGTVLLEMLGPGGKREPYLVKIEPGDYPVRPWRIGFVNPQATGPERLVAPDRDFRYWPYSQLPGLHGGFHVSFQGPYRVFVCLPFSVEYFYYHPEKPWRPDLYTLPRVVNELERAIRQATHFSSWWQMLVNPAAEAAHAAQAAQRR